MKLLLALLLIMNADLALSQSKKMPRYLKDGTVFVAIKNGRFYQFNSNDWKIVKRHRKARIGKRVSKKDILKFLEPRIPDRTRIFVPTDKNIVFMNPKKVKRSSAKVIKRPRRHTVIGHLGAANERIVIEEQNQRFVNVRRDFELALGATYSYNFDSGLSLGGTLINRTATVNVGYSFDYLFQDFEMVKSGNYLIDPNKISYVCNGHQELKIVFQDGTKLFIDENKQDLYEKLSE